MFSIGILVANSGKYCLLTSSKTSVYIHISNTEILNEEKVKLLGTNLEGRLNFNFNVNTLLRKSSKKYHRLAKAFNYMNKRRQPILMNAFVKSPFSDFPLLWKFHDEIMNKRNDKIR